MQGEGRLAEDDVKKEVNGWDYFDRLYCVSLREREDRRNSALKEFSKVGLADRVDFVLGERDPYNMEQGVYESHMMCLLKGLEAGDSNWEVWKVLELLTLCCLLICAANYQ